MFDFHHMIYHSTTWVSFFLETLSYLCVIMDALSSWTFHFQVGVICTSEVKIAKNTEWLYFGLARYTFLTNGGF